MLWSPQQSDCIRDVRRWQKNQQAAQVYCLFGYAGTGKTELAKHLADDGWLFAAFTGKAAHVMRQRGCHGASTIHSLIYRPAGISREQELRDITLKIAVITKEVSARKPTEIESRELARLTKIKRDLLDDRRPRFSIWENSRLWSSTGVVIDEVSMVDERLGRDLESFGKKILVLGDPAQLPPVGAGGYYTSRRPNTMLTEVHRHARESGILRLATLIREGRSIIDFDESADVTIIKGRDRASEARIAMYDSDQTLCGRNATRRDLNMRHRARLKRESLKPAPEDRIVCLRNDHSIGLYNGSQWVVQTVTCDEDAMVGDLEIVGEDDTNVELRVEAWLHHFLGASYDLKQIDNKRQFSEFDYSYALTVHKAQGSQWESVALLDESNSFKADARRWMYTGITRASKKLTVII